MNYKITNLEYGTGPWGTEMLYGGIGNPKPGETENNVHSVTLLDGDASRLVLTHDVTMHERFETEGREGLAVHYVAR